MTHQVLFRTGTTAEGSEYSTSEMAHQVLFRTGTTAEGSEHSKPRISALAPKSCTAVVTTKTDVENTNLKNINLITSRV